MNNLKQLREDHDISVDTLLKLLNVSRTTYYNYENEITFPSFNMLFVLSDFYNVSIDYILGHKVKEEIHTNFSLIAYMQRNNVDCQLSIAEKEAIKSIIDSLIKKNKAE